MSKTKFKSKKRRRMNSYNPLRGNCRVILTPDGDRGLQSCFKRHVKQKDITDKTK